ncbi:MAG: hypothetical protein HY207_03630 [Nitrospirae bacterium]|nr:hypothetical protein [Nitrospirota bacterium]
MSFSVETPPSPEEVEARIKFTTYLGYLRFFSQHLYDEYGTEWKSFAERCIAKSASTALCPNVDRKWLERFLKISWNTEFLLFSGPREPELMRINNQWVPIQAYYAVYAAAEAFAYVLDGKKADGHIKTLRKVTEFFSRFKLSPWDKAYAGPRGRDAHSHQPLNFPPEVKPADSNLKRVGVRPLEMIATCLRAEHSNRIDEYKRKPGKGGPYRYEYDPGATGILHFLYRLRVKSNYKEVDIFVQENIDYSETQAFFDCLHEITVWTLTFLEIMIMRKVGKQMFLALGASYLELNSQAAALKDRLTFYQSKIAK